MTIHPLRKFFGLVLLYLVIIFGIFALQFRNESSIVQLADKVKIILTKTRETSLKSRVEIIFFGIKISINERSPAFLLVETGRVPLALESWEQLSDRAAAFNFDNNARLLFLFDPETERVTLSGEIPEKTQMILPFQTMSGYSITQDSPARTIIASGGQTFSLIPGAAGRREIVISAENPAATYSPHTGGRVFSYEDSLDSALAAEAFYLDVVAASENRLIELFGAGADSGNEQTVVSYVAAMGARNRYAQALSSVPESFRSSRRRTYISAPYFNSLADMDESLAARGANLLSMMMSASQRASLDFFTMPDLADYLLREADTQSVTAFLSVPSAARQFEPSVSEAAGILNTYAALVSVPQNSPVASQSREYARLLEPVLDGCLEAVVSACSLDGGILTVRGGRPPEDSEQLGLIAAADVGAALINYGGVQDQAAIKNTGYFIVNSLGADIPRLDLRSLGELYSRFSDKGAYYPHSTVLASAQGRKIWAWNIARGIDYETDSRGDVTITIDFPAGDSHYLIVKGIAPFRAIEIYDTRYRSDSGFETYDSSGFMYDERTQTLYIKSWHRAEREVIRLIYYTPPAAPASVPAAAPPQELPVRIEEAPFLVD